MSNTAAMPKPLTAPEKSTTQENGALYRMLPHNLEAEQSLLGALLIDNRAIENVNEIITADHFFMPVHSRIFDAIIKIADRGQQATPITLKNYFETDSDLSDVGGADYLADLAASVISIINARDYAQTIYELHLRRNLITLGEEIVHESYSHTLDTSAQDTIETAESRLFSLAESGQVKGNFTTLRDSVIVAIEHAEKAFKTDGNVTGITAGMIDIDKKMGGFQNSDLIILAGRPSMGKTALATNFAYNAARAYARTGGKEGAIVAFFSLEMSSDQLATRILADRSGIPGDAIRKGNIKQDDFRKFVEASQELSQIPLYIDDTPALSISAVRTRARRLKRQHGLDMLVVDYLQLLRGTGSKQGMDNRVQEVAEITRGLKAIAKELQIPVIALSQLSRQVEQREDKRPMLSDLRESGSIEQDADIVMFVYREEYYLSRAEPEVGTEKHMMWQERMDKSLNVGECIVSKNRHGSIGPVRLHFNPNLTRFSDLDPNHEAYRGMGDDY